MEISPEFLDSIQADFCVHGDDLPIVRGGPGMYSASIEQGKCRIIKRTEGVSTTNIIGRLLTLSQPVDRTEEYFFFFFCATKILLHKNSWK